MKIKLHNYIVTMYTQQVESNEHVQQQQVKYRFTTPDNYSYFVTERRTSVTTKKSKLLDIVHGNFDHCISFSAFKMVQKRSKRSNSKQNLFNHVANEVKIIFLYNVINLYYSRDVSCS